VPVKGGQCTGGPRAQSFNKGKQGDFARAERKMGEPLREDSNQNVQGPCGLIPDEKESPSKIQSESNPILSHEKGAKSHKGGG